jgi:hypothetical protein
MRFAQNVKQTVSLRVSPESDRNKQFALQKPGRDWDRNRKTHNSRLFSIVLSIYDGQHVSDKLQFAVALRLS